MCFDKKVQVGRVVRIEEGQYEGKLAVIVNPISQKWVLIDGPTTGVPRHKMNVRQFRLTKFVVKCCHHSPSRIIKDAFESANIEKLWNETSWAKRENARSIRKSLNDFQRFQVSHLKQLVF